MPQPNVKETVIESAKFLSILEATLAYEAAQIRRLRDLCDHNHARELAGFLALHSSRCNRGQE